MVRFQNMGSQRCSSFLNRILRNECHLRGTRPEHWSDGLVQLSKHANAVFAGSTPSDTARTIHRPALSPDDPIAGYTFLDQKRAHSIRIQPSTSAFAERFHQLSNGLLRGLNWNNVCVAGGLALGTLLSPDTAPVVNETNPTTTSSTSTKHVNASQWKHSDIDIYIYGLGPVHANKKLQHIFETFKSNLPPGAPALLVRNSKTVTFFSHYPLRRVQVVLKQVESPRDVLLNFDLDVCAVAWDGKEVWLLPRACRALQSQ